MHRLPLVLATTSITVSFHPCVSLKWNLVSNYHRMDDYSKSNMHTKQSTMRGTPISSASQRIVLILSCRTAIGLRVKDGVVLAVEKLVTSKLLLPGANRRIQTVDRHMGVVSPPSHRYLSLPSNAQKGYGRTRA